MDAAHFVMQPFKQRFYLYSANPNYGHNGSILDLKAFYRGAKYLDELIKLLPEKLEPILISQILNRLANIGGIHPISLSNIPTE